jgi:hypothetical protein
VRRRVANRTPWLRIFAEGLAIVVSILLAFAIQAWWEGRQARADAVAALATLATDIQVARPSVESAQARRLGRVDVIVSLLAASTGQDPVSADSLYAWIGELWGAQAPRTPLASLEELRSSGVFVPIEADDFQRALSTFGRSSAVLALQEERVLQSWENELRPYLVANSDVLRQLQGSTRETVADLIHALPPRFDPGLDQILDDRQFQNLLLVRLNRTRGAINAGANILSQLDELETLTLRELGRP